MTADPPEAAAPTSAPEPSAVQSNDDAFDPLRWELPVVCKDCNKEFPLPYRHFQAGVVFHCPHCHGSYVPTLPMYRKVHDAFETFYARMRRVREEIAQSGDNDAAFRGRLDREVAEFHDALERLARELRPAGKMIRRRGLAAMFT